MIEVQNNNLLQATTKPIENKKWDWLPCIYDFKQEYDGKEIIWNFSPYVMLSGDDFNVSNLLQDTFSKTKILPFSPITGL